MVRLRMNVIRVVISNCGLVVFMFLVIGWNVLGNENNLEVNIVGMVSRNLNWVVSLWLSLRNSLVLMVDLDLDILGISVRVWVILIIMVFC